MPSVMDTRHREAIVLARSVESVCRKLVRFLIGKMSLVKLQEIIRYVFVEEIENKLREESPSKNIPLTQLALLSGLDTRTLTKIRNSKKYGQPLHQEKRFLKEFTPGASILDYWSSKSPYCDPTSGKPIILRVKGDSPSFESLFRETTTSRGITYKSLLKRLVEGGSVAINNDKDEITLISRSYLPSDSADSLGALEMGFSAVGNMIDTVVRNIESIDSGRDRLYQRGAWTYRLNKKHQAELRNSLKNLLESTDNRARRIIEQHEDKRPGTDQLTAGVSLFYFEESSEN